MAIKSLNEVPDPLIPLFPVWLRIIVMILFLGFDIFATMGLWIGFQKGKVIYLIVAIILNLAFGTLIVQGILRIIKERKERKYGPQPEKFPRFKRSKTYFNLRILGIAAAILLAAYLTVVNFLGLLMGGGSNLFGVLVFDALVVYSVKKSIAQLRGELGARIGGETSEGPLGPPQ